jgi:hypothetical protein
MAVVEIFQGREIPEARVLPPSAENTFAEQFGNGLQEVGQAAIRAANAAQRADDAVREKNNAAWLGKTKPQAMIDIDRRIDDLEANAAEGAPGHVAAVEKIFSDYREMLGKSAPDASTAAELDSFILALEAERIGGARRFQKSSEIAQRSLDIERGVSSLGGVVASKGDQLPWARSELDSMIDWQGLPADKAAELKRQSQMKLTDAYLGGFMLDHPDMVAAACWRRITRSRRKCLAPGARPLRRSMPGGCPRVPARSRCVRWSSGCWEAAGRKSRKRSQGGSPSSRWRGSIRK